MDVREIRNEIDLNKTNFELLARVSKDDYAQIETIVTY